MAVVGFFVHGIEAKSNIVMNLTPGPIRVVVEVMLLLHLVTAFPIITNPPAQYFEKILKIPASEKNSTVYTHTL